MSRHSSWTKINGLLAWIGIPSLLCLFLGAKWQEQAGGKRFEEISVERINIVDADGSLKMVISNADRMHAGRVAGVDIPDRQRPPGILFFDDEGDEAGGLGIFGSKESRQGGFMIDQIGNDESVRLLSQQVYTENGFVHNAGLSVADRNPDLKLPDVMKAMEEFQKIQDPKAMEAKAKELQEEGVFGAERMFVGRRSGGEVLVDLRDAAGKPRLRMTVTGEGDARIEFLDDAGTVLKTISAK